MGREDLKALGGQVRTLLFWLFIFLAGSTIIMAIALQLGIWLAGAYGNGKAIEDLTGWLYGNGMADEPTTGRCTAG